MKYRTDLDGIRAIAILGIMLFNAHLGVPGGFVGVDVFFVLSGYFISNGIVESMNDGSFSVLHFWKR